MVFILLKSTCELREGLLHNVIFSFEFSEFHLKLATEVAWIARQHQKKGLITVNDDSAPLFDGGTPKL